MVGFDYANPVTMKFFLNNSVFKMKTEEIILNKEKKGNRVSQSLGRVATILISFKF